MYWMNKYIFKLDGTNTQKNSIIKDIYVRTKSDVTEWLIW
jgi:uncharacterized membrane-anchored protein